MNTAFLHYVVLCDDSNDPSVQTVSHRWYTNMVLACHHVDAHWYH